MKTKQKTTFLVCKRLTFRGNIHTQNANKRNFLKYAGKHFSTFQLTHELSYKKNHNEFAVKFVLLSPRLELEPAVEKRNAGVICKSVVMLFRSDMLQISQLDWSITLRFIWRRIEDFACFINGRLTHTFLSENIYESSAARLGWFNNYPICIPF